MGWTAQQTRVWMVRDRQAGWREEKGGRAPADGGAVVETEVAEQVEVIDIAPPTDDDEDDARELRMDRVAVLYGEITAATRAFLSAVAECDRHRDWEHAGFGSCAEWWVPHCRSPLHSRPAASALTALRALRLSFSQ